MSNLALSVGQKVELNDERVGRVRFVGTTAFQTGEWVGVELEDASGKNDGSVQGKRYFDCPPAHGIFCRVPGVSRVLEEPKPKTKQSSNGAPVKPRPSSIQSAPNGSRRQTLQQEGATRKGTLQDSPTPAGRPASGIRSPVKSPTKQLGTNGASSSSTSRTGTPPVVAKRTGPRAGVTAKTARPSIGPSAASAAAAPARRTTTTPGATRTTGRQPPSSSVASRVPGSRAVSGTVAPARTGGSVRTNITQRLAAAKEESTGDEASERSSLVSPRESTTSDVASQGESESAHGDEDDTITKNFAPPPVPPIPAEPAEKMTRTRRPSSPAAASVHSQRTIRSGAASNRQIEELEAKVRLLERKRHEDRELKQSLEKAEQDRDQYKGIIEKLQNKYRPQQQELEKLKREAVEYEAKANDIEELQMKHDVELESALVDREFAEEQADQYKTDLEMVRARNEELELELEVCKDEIGELSKEMSPEERTSTGWLQLEKSNDRLKAALISLRDMTQDREAELKEQIEGLEDQVKGFDTLKTQHEDTREQLLRSQADTEDLRQQLEVALNAEEMIERLSEENESLRDKISDLRAAIEDLESLRELNDELDINHVEAEKQLQEEIDFKDSILLDRERTIKEQQAAYEEADYNINRFRDLVGQLQTDLQDMQSSKQLSESEAAQLSDKSRAVMDLNHKLQSSASKTQIKTIDLELRRLDAQQASEHLEIVQLFLPEAFQAEHDSVQALLRFKRIGFKATLIQTSLKERVSTYGTRGQDDDVFATCDAMEKLTWVAAMSERLVNSIRGCSAEAFSRYGEAYRELEVVERTLNDYVEALRRDELKTQDMPVRLGRLIDVLTHLAGSYLQGSLSDHADELFMKTMLLQTRMDTATSALVVTRTMIEAHLHTTPADDESEDENVSDTALILNRLKTIIDLTRNAKVVSGKTHRALSELQLRHLTLEEQYKGQFEDSETVASEITAYACHSGAELQGLFGEEGRAEAFTPSEVAAALSRSAASIFSLSGAEAGPYATLAGKLRDLGSALTDLAILPTDLDNTVEFERGTEPWKARADELKQTKITSIDVEAELARSNESVKERDTLIKQKETELEEQSVRIEMLEARMKDASKRSAKIAELERHLREAKDGENRAKSELLRAQQEALHDVERVREEMARLAEERQTSSTGTEVDGNAMGTSTRVTMKRYEHKIAGLETAVQYLKQDNLRLRLPSANAPLATQSILRSIQGPLVPLQRSSNTTRLPLRREGEKVVADIIMLASSPLTVDLAKTPENKLAWRPAKDSSRWKVERRKEQYVDWKQYREDVVRNVARESVRTNNRVPDFAA